jgi:hypothetical protein
MLADMADMVERFNREIIGLPIPREPERLSAVRKDWAISALTEEVEEFRDAKDIDEEADALIDMTYFALGRLIEMGICPRPLFEEVHRANMKKQRGMLSKRPASLGYDAVKPDGWTAPELMPLLSVTLADAERVLEERMADHFEDATPHEQRKPRILVLGHARHGKDTVCEMLRDRYGLTFTSSSMFCAEKVVWPAMQRVNREWLEASETQSQGRPFPDYASAQECFDDRGNHRAFWYDTITKYNESNRGRLAREIFAENDVYAGVRNKNEFHAIKNAGLYDVAIWVDRSDHLPPEDRASCTVEPWMADFVLDNNGTLEETGRNLEAIMGYVADFQSFLRRAA